MPKIGDVRRGIDIGFKTRNKVIWQACVNCGKERWVQFRNGEPVSLRCIPCGVVMHRPIEKQSTEWRGKIFNSRGYISVHTSTDDFFYPMADSIGYVGEHRLVMAKHLGRCLQPWEMVHHKNHKRDDNRIENLQLVTDQRHTQITILENKIQRLEKRVRELEFENLIYQLSPEQQKEFVAEVQRRLTASGH